MSTTGKYFLGLIVLLGMLLFCLLITYYPTEDCTEIGCLQPAFTYLAVLLATVVVAAILVLSAIVVGLWRAWHWWRGTPDD